MVRRLSEMLAEANVAVESLSAEEALKLAGDPGALFVDVRERHERESSGTIPGAVHAPRGFLEFIADREGPMHDHAFDAGKRLVVFCASGSRSALAAKTLKDMGFEDVATIAGGFKAWREAGGGTQAVEE